MSNYNSNNNERQKYKIINPSAEITPAEETITNIGIRQKLNSILKDSYEDLKQIDKNLNIKRIYNDLLETADKAIKIDALVSAGCFLASGAAALGITFFAPETDSSHAAACVCSIVNLVSAASTTLTGLSILDAKGSADQNKLAKLGALAFMPPVIAAKLATKAGRIVTGLGAEITESTDNNEMERR